MAMRSPSDLVDAACQQLGIDHLVLTVHDASFPSRAHEDIGRGSPYSHGAADLLAFIADLGFNSLQLGPQGKTSFADPSPYNGAQFARSHQSLDLAALRAHPQTRGLIGEHLLQQAVEHKPEKSRERMAHGYSFRVLDAALREAYRTFAAAPHAFGDLADELEQFRTEQAPWLEADSLYEALAESHGSDHFQAWPTHGPYALDARLYHPRNGEHDAARERRSQLARSHADTLNRNAFTQLLLEREHRTLRETAKRRNLRLWADFQIGYAARDLWRWSGVFLPGYHFGAPPSRTSPLGQPWAYPVLDPAQISIESPEGRVPGPAALLLRERVSHLLDDFDGLRIDHPHGLVCPWVYRSDDPDPGRAVRAGARLRSSPSDPNHPALAAFAIARQCDLAPAHENRLPYADEWVATLSAEQVDRYAELFEIIVEQMAAHGRDESDLAAEVLSTCPYPVARVLSRHGLGRFRVVQKANPDDPRDPYRSQSASPSDWMMLGTHDTHPIWRVTDSWAGGARAASWGRYLAARIARDERDREALAGRLAADPQALTHALFADLFLGPARHVCVFFADLFGMTDTYNTPGTIGEGNWRLRVPADFADEYERRRLAGRALDLCAALGTALRVTAADTRGDCRDLASALLAHAAPAAIPRP
jgi:4-alpha-glucanotransferase